MKRTSLWLSTAALVIIGLLIYWDHNFTDFGLPAMSFTSVLIALTLIIAIIATFSEGFNRWIGGWWVIPDGILFGFASMLDYTSIAKVCVFALLMIVCIFVEIKLFDDKHAN